jgi:hypothetical protein
MPVYVDRAKNPYGRMIMSHMLADSLVELHAMADRIGLARRHFQPLSTPHYDVCQAYRAKAIQAGAIEIDRVRTAALIREWRQPGRMVPT